MNTFQRKTEVSQLSQFRGRKVELSLPEPNITFIFQSFNWSYSDDVESLVLYDQTEIESKYYIPLNEVIEVTNMMDDIYCDVIGIRTEKFVLSICLMEEKPLCDGCGEDLSKGIPWQIICVAGYGSQYDREKIHLKYCYKCMLSIFDLEVDNDE